MAREAMDVCLRVLLESKKSKFDSYCTVPGLSRAQPLRQPFSKQLYKAFPLTWPVATQIYWNKRMFLHKKKVQLSKDWFDTPTWLPFYSFVTKQYGGRDAMLNEYEWHPTTGNKKPRNQEIYSKKITGLYHVMFNLEIRVPASCQT